MTPLHILLVEDEPQTAQMMRFYLEREGFAVSRARDGPAGEAAFRVGQSHLVILDSMLPGFDGLTLFRRIRQTSTLPVLMLTTRAEDTDEVIGTGISAADYGPIFSAPGNPLRFAPGICDRVVWATVSMVKRPRNARALGLAGRANAR